jgi:hypothetical protein
MIDLSSIDQVVALAPADIDSVELVGLQREASDRQRLALLTGFLDPVIAAAGGISFILGLTIALTSDTQGRSRMP